jgi:hypothetical protein
MDGMGLSATLMTILGGVLNVLKIKKIAVLATVFSAGALAFALVERAKVVGQTPNPILQSGDQLNGYDPRPLGPDGRRIGALPPRDGKSPYPRKYYVGDLALPQPPDRQGKTTGSDAIERVMVDLTALVDLIQMTVAPGTWVVEDGRGHELPPKAARRGAVVANQRNRITPLLIFGSLGITCPEEVHEDIRNLLYGLRRLQDPRDEAIVGGTRLAMLVPVTAFANPPTANPGATPTAEGRARVDQILKQAQELVHKIEALPTGSFNIPLER